MKMEKTGLSSLWEEIVQRRIGNNLQTHRDHFTKTRGHLSSMEEGTRRGWLTHQARWIQLVGRRLSC
jgi:hypothetical protein